SSNAELGKIRPFCLSGCVRASNPHGACPSQVAREQETHSLLTVAKVVTWSPTLSLDIRVRFVSMTATTAAVRRTPQWHPTSWQAKPAQQQATYADPKALERAVAALSQLPPIVVSWEVEVLRAHLAAAQRGERFLLQGGDCAESFDDCDSDKI